MEFAHQIIRYCASRRIAILGIGNLDRGDDGYGIRVAESLKKLFPKNVFLESEGIDGIISEIKAREDIECVLFLDAIERNTHPGKIEVIEKERIGEISSSHEVPIKLYCALVEKPCLLLGIQPKRIEFGVLISPEVEQGIEKTISALSSILREKWGQATI
jgi:hydrogenase maturation protease